MVTDSGTGKQWDVFCRVVDNFGDIGVCWRLAADLASRGERVRLWLDDISPLRWMAPEGAAGVTVLPWGMDSDSDSDVAATVPGDVVIEAFGCDPPPSFVQRMAQRQPAPVWINLEYLSAEPAAERNHRLPSPQLSGPGAGLTKWFFYPGFTVGTGGLIRENDLQARQQIFNAKAWLEARGWQRREHEQKHEQVVSLFCYDNPRVPELLAALSKTPTLLLATPGPAADQVLSRLGSVMTLGALRAIVLPRLTQQDFDRLLWACDLNFVRGEDSFVRAQWAAKPFVWQIYPQHDGVHEAKLDAFMNLFLHAADSSLASDLRSVWRAWNGLSNQTVRLPKRDPWRRHAEAWRNDLLAQPDLVSQLLSFVAERR